MLLYRCSPSLRAIITTAAMSLSATVAHAYSMGVTTLDFDSSGCNQCHFGGLAPTVQLSGPMLVAPGSTNEYTLQVGAVGNQNKAGLNVSATAGVLTTGGSDSASTQVLNGTGNRNEITQVSPKLAVNGTVTFTFLWTAPESGSAVLTAWGNAVNGNFNRSGDQAASFDLTISVGSTNPTETPTPTATPTMATPMTSPTPTATATAGPSACVGDCDASGAVTVDEIVTMVNIALGSADASACPNGVPSGESVDVALIIKAVGNALATCGRRIF
jgi:hypothetical protein